MDTDSVETEEGWLNTPDQFQLYTKTWKPDGQLKARLVFLHGFSDHCNWYKNFFSFLAKKGIKVYSFDQRGWGRSVHETKQQGLSGPPEQVMLDVTTFIRSLPDNEQVPLFLMGHSMGGGEVLVYASTAPSDVVSKIRGFLLESPLIGLAPDATPWKLTVVLGRLAARVAPHMKMLRKLDPKTLSRDPAVCQAWVDDKLNHDTATLQMLAGLLDRTNDLDSGRIVLKEGLGEGGRTRVWLGHGTKDAATDYDSSQRWYNRINVDDKTFRVYEGWYHKLHCEPGGDDVIFANDVTKWILDRCGPLDKIQTGGPKSKL